MRQCCTDHKGKKKRKYQTKEEAEKAAELRNDEGIAVKVYPCEEGDGWHLTSQNAPPPDRPKNIMTQAEKNIYTKRTRNLLGNLIGEDIMAQIKDGAEKNTLVIHQEKIEQFQQEYDERYRDYKECKKDAAIVRQRLKLAEHALRMVNQNLYTAKNEYELAKRRIMKKR